jgi:hypothetical protein
MDDDTAFFTSLRENLQREDMSLFDEARAYKKLMTDGFTQTDISKKLNISQAKISQALAISKFDDIPDFHFYNINENKVCKENAVESAIISQLITPSHAQELLKLVRFFEEVNLEKDMWCAPLFFKIDEIICKEWSTGDLRFAIDDYICGFVDYALIKKSIYLEGDIMENKPDHINNPMLNRYKIPFKYIEMALKFHAKHGDFKEGEQE